MDAPLNTDNGKIYRNTTIAAIKICHTQGKVRDKLAQVVCSQLQGTLQFYFRKLLINHPIITTLPNNKT